MCSPAKPPWPREPTITRSASRAASSIADAAESFLTVRVTTLTPCCGFRSLGAERFSLLLRRVLGHDFACRGFQHRRIPRHRRLIPDRHDPQFRIAVPGLFNSPFQGGMRLLRAVKSDHDHKGIHFFHGSRLSLPIAAPRGLWPVSSENWFPLDLLAPVTADYSVTSARNANCAAASARYSLTATTSVKPSPNRSLIQPG